MQEATFLQFMSDGQWHTCREIAQHFNLSGSASTIRGLIRPMKVFKDGGLISNSRRGFKLASMATRRELEHTYNALISRAEEIKRRAELLNANYIPHGE